MIIRVKPYYCPHCKKFKSKYEVYQKNGSAPCRGGGRIEGWLTWCNGCDTMVEKVEPKIRQALYRLMESEE